MTRHNPEPAAVRLRRRLEPNENGCLVWQGSVTTSGYGQLRGDDGRLVTAHRLAWVSEHGPIPDGLVLDHLCRTRLCCNVAHLEVVTQRENIVRGTGPSAANARRTHCNQGHSLVEGNLYALRSGRGTCRACALDRARRRRTGRQT